VFDILEFAREGRTVKSIQFYPYPIYLVQAIGMIIS
jgi:hypothetical protein